MIREASRIRLKKPWSRWSRLEHLPVLERMLADSKKRARNDFIWNMDSWLPSCQIIVLPIDLDLKNSITLLALCNDVFERVRTTFPIIGVEITCGWAVRDSVGSGMVFGCDHQMVKKTRSTTSSSWMVAFRLSKDRTGNETGTRWCNHYQRLDIESQVRQSLLRLVTWMDGYACQVSVCTKLLHGPETYLTWKLKSEDIGHIISDDKLLEQLSSDGRYDQTWTIAADDCATSRMKWFLRTDDIWKCWMHKIIQGRNGTTISDCGLHRTGASLRKTDWTFRFSYCIADVTSRCTS